MQHRRSTTWMALVSLFIALFLLTHDAVMAAGPHHPQDRHASLHHAPTATSTASVTAAATETDCGTFVAVRDDRTLGSRSLDAAPPAIVAPASTSRAAPHWAVAIAPGVPRAQLRASLQIWRE